MRNDAAKMGFATLVSGLVSGLTITFLASTQIAPGVFFGLATMLVFASTRRMRGINNLLWLIASTLSWYLAFRLYAVMANSSGGMDVSSMLSAGAIGSLLLGSSMSLIQRSLVPLNILATFITGTFLALVMEQILITYGTSINPLVLGVAFAIWQVGVGQTLLFYHSKNQFNP